MKACVPSIMKKYVVLLVLFAIAIIYNLFSLRENHSRVIRVGVECDHVPYNWLENVQRKTNFPLINKPGHFADGYDVQIAALVAKEIGADIEFIHVEWDDLIPALQRGEIDAIFSGMVDTDERKKIIDFSIPYEIKKIEYAVLIRRKSNYSDAESLNDFSGARFVAQKASRFDEVIDQIPGVIHLPPLDTQAQVIEELDFLQADATVLNYDTALSYERRDNKIFKTIHFDDGKGFVLGFTGLCAGVRKTDTKLLKDINEAIDSISTRERQKIMDRAIIRAGDNL